MTKNDAELMMTKSDLEFCTLLVSEKIAVLSFPMLPYMSLIILEASKYLNIQIDNAHLTTLRAKAKFLDDNKSDIAENLDLLKVILQCHQNHFYKPDIGILSRIRNWFQKDLGVFKYESKFIGTSILFNFYAFHSPSNTLLGSDFSTTMYSVGLELGKLMSQISSHTGNDLSLESDRKSAFLEKKVTCCDFKFQTYYSKLFFGNLSPEIVQLLQINLSMLTLSSYVLESSWVNSFTLFKIRFLALFHVLSSIRKLQGYFRVNNLSDKRSDFIFSQISSDQPAKLILSNKKFRNIIVHYKFNNTGMDFDENLTLFGLVENSFPNNTYDTLSALVDTKIKVTIELLADWMNSVD